MRIRQLLAGTAITAIGLVSFAGPASANHGPPVTKDKVIGVVRIDRNDPSVAHVLAKYRCTIADPINHPGHLWVSVKQNEAGTIDPAIEAEGSGGSGTAVRWEDSHRNEINCNGKFHTKRFTVDQIEDKSTYETLVKGHAWVQFCLFDDTTPQGDGQTDFGEPVSSMVWARVA